MPLNNFGLVTPHIFRCAQPNAQAIGLLKEMGATVIYKLNNDSEFPVRWEADAFAPGQVQYDPNISSFRPDKNKLLTAARQLHEFSEAKAIVALHCTHGRDRTGAVAATFKIIYGSKVWAEVLSDFLSYDNTGMASIFDMGIIDVLKEIYFDTFGVKP